MSIDSMPEPLCEGFIGGVLSYALDYGLPQLLRNPFPNWTKD